MLSRVPAVDGGKDKMPTNLIFSLVLQDYLTRIKVKKFRKTGEEFKKFLGRRKVGPLIRLDIVYHSSKVNEFDKDDIYSMLHLLHPKRKNIKPASKYPAFHLHTSVAISTNRHFFFFFGFRCTYTYDYFAYQKFRIPENRESSSIFQRRIKPCVKRS